MIGPVAQRRNFARHRWQLTSKEIPERHAKCIDVLTIAVDEIHRNIESVLNPCFKAKPVFEDKGDHPGAVCIQIAPYPAAPGFMAISLTLKKGRIGK